MSGIDEKILKELENETQAIDDLIQADGGLPDMVSAAFKGSMRRWVWFTTIIVFVLTMLMFWTGYQFFLAETADDRVFWGIWFLFSAMPQIAIKQWQWMEMNRANLMREIKRLEVAIAVLAQQRN